MIHNCRDNIEVFFYIQSYKSGRRNMKLLYSIIVFVSLHVCASEDPQNIFKYISQEKYDRVIEMIESGIDVNIKDVHFYNDTPLIAISYKYAGGNEKALLTSRMLLERKAEPDFRNGFGTDAAALAVRFHPDIRMLSLLVESGAELTGIYYQHGESMLHINMENNNSGAIDIFNFLVKKGANINLQNNAGMTPLIKVMKLNYMEHEGCGFRRLQIRALIDAGADMEVEDKYFGLTALKHGIMTAGDVFCPGYPDIKYLLEAGAKVDQEAIDMAGNYELRAILMKYMLCYR